MIEPQIRGQVTNEQIQNEKSMDETIVHTLRQIMSGNRGSCLTDYTRNPKPVHNVQIPKINGSRTGKLEKAIHRNTHLYIVKLV